jgi:aspartate 1-decarboxylase
VSLPAARTNHIIRNSSRCIATNTTNAAHADEEGDNAIIIRCTIMTKQKTFNQTLCIGFAPVPVENENKSLELQKNTKDNLRCDERKTFIYFLENSLVS